MRRRIVDTKARGILHATSHLVVLRILRDHECLCSRKADKDRVERLERYIRVLCNIRVVAVEKIERKALAVVSTCSKRGIHGLRRRLAGGVKIRERKFLHLLGGERGSDTIGIRERRVHVVLRDVQQVLIQRIANRSRVVAIAVGLTRSRHNGRQECSLHRRLKRGLAARNDTNSEIRSVVARRRIDREDALPRSDRDVCSHIHVGCVAPHELTRLVCLELGSTIDREVCREGNGYACRHVILTGDKISAQNGFLKIGGLVRLQCFFKYYFFYRTDH